jgi:hypothetical protein
LKRGRDHSRPSDRKSQCQADRVGPAQPYFGCGEGIAAAEAKVYFEEASQLALAANNMRANALIHAAYGGVLAASGSADDVAKLESFKGQTPYEVQGDGQTTASKVPKDRSAAAGQRARSRASIPA